MTKYIAALFAVLCLAYGANAQCPGGVCGLPQQATYTPQAYYTPQAVYTPQAYYAPSAYYQQVQPTYYYYAPQPAYYVPRPTYYLPPRPARPCFGCFR